MATGKTTVGRLLATELQRAFVDCDDQLTARTGLAASQIAERDGIDALHRIEADVLLDAVGGDEPAVITAAASTIEDARCRAALEPAFVAWLRADVAVLASRARAQPHRPLNDDVAAQLRAQAQRRDVLFASASDITIDVDAASPGDTARLIARGVGHHSASDIHDD
jgi:shikimate kinase